jgi:glucose-6-phosphate dehydrogenase assembly protein OpcA
MENVVSPQVVSFQPRPVDVDAIEHELASLWQSAHEGGEEVDKVTRASMSNLIIFSAAGKPAETIAAEITDIVRIHQARVLLLAADREHSEPPIEAWVSAHCRIIDRDRQVCSEHITVQTGRHDVKRLPSVARSLLIGDLPTALWWAFDEAPPSHEGLFRELSAMADQVLYESTEWSEPVRGVADIAEWVKRQHPRSVVSDLAWRRLKPWRRLISQALDPAVMPGALTSIDEVIVGHGPHALPQAWLLIGWLAACLNWRATSSHVNPGTHVTWEFATESSPVRVTVRRSDRGEPVLRSVRVCWQQQNKRHEVEFAMIGNERIGAMPANASTPTQTISAPVQPRAYLVAQQLPDRAYDALFSRTLAIAGAMAQALLTRQ